MLLIFSTALSRQKGEPRGGIEAVEIYQCKNSLKLSINKKETADYKRHLKFCNPADTNPDLKTKDSIAHICLVYFRSVTLLAIVL